MVEQSGRCRVRPAVSYLSGFSSQHTGTDAVYVFGVSALGP